MILRLLLVGMVSVLGIPLPDGADLWTSLSWARTGATACACPREAVPFELIAADDGAIDRIADELNRQSDGMDIPTVPVATVAKIDPVAKIFADNDVWAAPADAVANTDAVAKLFAENDVWAALAEVEPVDTVARIFADNDVWAGVAVEVPAPGRIEPIAAVETATIADELNRAAEGPTIAPAPAPEPTVGTAMKLTRDAALAWLNVLTKTTTEAAR